MKRPSLSNEGTGVTCPGFQEGCPRSRLSFLGPPSLLPQAQAWPQTWSVSWLQPQVRWGTYCPSLGPGAREGGCSCQSPRPGLPLSLPTAGATLAHLTRGARLRPRGHRITEHPSCKNLGNRRLSLLIQLLGKQKPGKRCGPLKDTEHPGCAVWLPAQGLSQNLGAPTCSLSRWAHGLSLPQLKYLI